MTIGLMDVVGQGDGLFDQPPGRVVAGKFRLDRRPFALAELAQRVGGEQLLVDRPAVRVLGVGVHDCVSFG